jgi:iron complex outermembrane receptor protein
MQHAASKSPSTLAIRPARSTMSYAVFLACLAIGLGTGVPDALAQTASGYTSEKQYDIPAGSLDQVLNRFATSAGILLSIDGSLTTAKQSAGLSGRYDVAAAFAKILANSGLEAVQRGQNQYLIRTANTSTPATTTLPTVQVTSSLSESTSGPASGYASVGVLGNKSLRDTPYSMSVINREQLENTQSSSMVDALRGDASVSATSNNIGGLASQIAVRGVTLDLLNGRKIDGMNVFSWSADLPLEHFEELQLLKGAGGLLYGVAAPGGTINFISKRPTDEPLRSIKTAVTDRGAALLHADVGGRFGESTQFGYRVNAVTENGESYVKGSNVKQTSGSIALDWRITPDLIWSVDALKINRETRGASGWGLFPNASGTATDFVAARPPSSIRGSDRIYSPFTSYETEAVVYGTDLAWKISPDWTAKIAYKTSTMDRTYLNGSIYANAAGAYTEEMYSGTDRFKTYDALATVSGKITTGSIVHDISFGATHGKNRGYTSSISGYAVLGSGNLSAPGNFANPNLPIGPADTLNSDVNQRSTFITDTLHLGSQWDVLLGLRNISINDKVNKYDKSATTPTVAVIYKPTSWISAYSSYIESLEQGSTAPITAANRNQVFGPLKSKQVEVGVKAEGKTWEANAALFRLNRGLTYTTSSNIFTQDGEARYTGFELGGKVRVTPQWLLGVSALFLNSENTKTSADLEGKRVAGAPRQQFSAYTEYKLPDTQWVFLAGGRYYGERYIDTAEKVSLSSYTLFDAGIRYVTSIQGARTTLRFNIENLTDKAYWQTSASYLTQGAPRTARLSAQFEF